MTAPAHAQRAPIWPSGVVDHWCSGTRKDVAEGVTVVLCTYRRAESVRAFLDSLATQSRVVDHLIVVDASDDEATDGVVAACAARFMAVEYWRVTGPLKGLTRQRNFGLDRVTTDLVAYFDDDVVLHRDCVREMERAHRETASLVGVGCFAETWTPPTALWRLRRALGIVSSLEPGSYSRSGMSVPWRFGAPTRNVVFGDWLPGCAMMLDTSVTSRLRFDSHLSGYAQGEDLEFSLRLRQEGQLAMAGAATCQHFHAPAGRPDGWQLGRMEIANRYRIWRRVHARPGLSDWFVFTYAWTLDTLLLLRDVVHPGRATEAVRRLAGRGAGAWDVLAGRM